MLSSIPLGVRLSGLAAIAFGLVGFAYGDFAAVWQPVPAAVPGRTALAYLVAALLLLAGLALQRAATARAGALTLTLLYGLGAMLLHLPLVTARPLSLGSWSGFAEQMALVAGGIMAYALSPGRDQTRWLKPGHILFGICLVCFGAVHFTYLAATASYVPSWLPPGQVFWACITGAAHLAAAMALLCSVLALAAAQWLMAMFVGFTLLVHLPALLADPSNHFNWAANAMNLALIGTAWTTVGAIRRATTLTGYPSP